MSMDDGGDQGLLKVFVECKPSTADDVLAEIRSVAADMSAGHITTDELEAARRPALAEEVNARTTTNWWVQKLNGSARDPVQLADARSWLGFYGSISLDSVRSAARDWLSPTSYAVEALPAPPPQYIKKKSRSGPTYTGPLRVVPPFPAQKPPKK
jgi:hypothetical protein